MARTLVLSTLRSPDSAHGGAAPEMCDNDASACDVRCNLRKPLRHVFVRETVKPITSHPLAVELLGNCEVIRNGGVGAMEGSIKAGDLRQPREAFEDRANWR